MVPSHRVTCGVAVLVALVTASETVQAQAATAPRENRDLAVEVAPKPPKRPQKAEVPVQVSLMSIGASTLNVGAPIRFQVSSNRASFGHVYVANTSGQVTLLCENIRLRAGDPVAVPRPGLILRAAAPAGDNRIVFVATRQRFAGFAGGATTTTPRDIQVGARELSGRLDEKLADLRRDDWGMTTMSVRVLP